jgi:hypothetical protein
MMAFNPFVVGRLQQQQQQQRRRQPQQPLAISTAAVRGGSASPAPASARPPCDWKAVGKYVGATALQLAAIGGFLWCIEWAFAATKLAPVFRLWVVRLFFALTSLKSRVFSVLDNSRPSVAREEQRKREKKRPGWM